MHGGNRPGATGEPDVCKVEGPTVTMSIDVPSLLGKAHELRATAARFDHAQDATPMRCPQRFPSGIAETVDATQIRIANAGQRLAGDASRLARNLETEALWVVATDKNMATPILRFMMSRRGAGASQWWST